jgi:hypothetical protein
VNDGQAIRGKQNVHIRDVTGSSRADPAWCPWSRRWWPWAGVGKSDFQKIQLAYGTDDIASQGPAHPAG